MECLEWGEHGGLTMGWARKYSAKGGVGTAVTKSDMARMESLGCCENGVPHGRKALLRREERSYSEGWGQLSTRDPFASTAASQWLSGQRNQ